MKHAKRLLMSAASKEKVELIILKHSPGWSDKRGREIVYGERVLKELEEELNKLNELLRIDSKVGP